MKRTDKCRKKQPPANIDQKTPKTKAGEGKEFHKKDKDKKKGKGKNGPKKKEPKPKAKIELKDYPSSSKQATETSVISKTPSSISNKAQLPSEQNGSQKLSIGTITGVTMILIGIVVLVAFVVIRKRSSSRRSRKGAVRLYDEHSYGDSIMEKSGKQRFINNEKSITSARIPSMPPTVKLSRIPSAISFDYNSCFENDSESLKNNSRNLHNNDYLSPYTKNHNLSGPDSSSRITLSDYNDYNSTDYKQYYPTHQNYYQKRQSDTSSRDSSSSSGMDSLGGFFPVPPQRFSANRLSTASTINDTFNKYDSWREYPTKI